MKIKSLILFSLMSAMVTKAEIIPLPENFVRAEIQVESNGKTNAVGDFVHGKPTAIGVLQIHKICWQDSVNYNQTLNKKYGSNNYSNCFNYDYSVDVMTAYLNKYEKKAIKNKDYENLAKCWNGGPNWRNKTGQAKINLNNYWNKVKKELNKNKISSGL